MVKWYKLLPIVAKWWRPRPFAGLFFMFVTKCFASSSNKPQKENGREWMYSRNSWFYSLLLADCKWFEWMFQVIKSGWVGLRFNNARLVWMFEAFHYFLALAMNKLRTASRYDKHVWGGVEHHILEIQEFQEPKWSKTLDLTGSGILHLTWFSCKTKKTASRSS